MQIIWVNCHDFHQCQIDYKEKLFKMMSYFFFFKMNIYFFLKKQNTISEFYISLQYACDVL